MKKFLHILFLVLIASCQLMVSADNADNADNTVKRLVLFAGPSKAESVGVNRFFQVHAPGDDSHSKSLKGWLWPLSTLSLSGAPYEAFDQLVYQYDNTEVRKTLLQGIQRAWDWAKYGVIIGSEAFDDVEEGEDSPGLRAMNAIVEQLGITPDQVTVVLNYRMPRLDQYVQIWKTHMHGFQHADYSDIVCHDNHENNWLLKRLETSMNPMKLVEVYRGQRWKVVMIDLQGVSEAGRDVGDVVACEVLDHTNCTNGFVTDLASIQYYGDWSSNFNQISAADQQKLEIMFQNRDCYYKKELMNDRYFTILYQSAIWKGCYDYDNFFSYYKQLALTPLIIEEIQDQVGCTIPITVEAPKEEPKDVKLVGKASWEKAAYTKLWTGVAAATSLLVALMFLVFWRRMGFRKRSSAIQNPAGGVASPRGVASPTSGQNTTDTPQFEDLGDAEVEDLQEVDVREVL